MTAGAEGRAVAAEAITSPAGHRAVRTAIGLWVATALATLAGMILTVVAWDDLVPRDAFPNLGGAVAAFGYAALGVLIVRRAGNVIGWLMLGEGAGLAFLSFASAYAVIGVVTHPGTLPAAELVGTLADCSFVPTAFTLAFMLFLFPSGTLPSWRWRAVAAAGLVAAGLTLAGFILEPRLVALPAPGGVSLTFQNPLATGSLGPVSTVLVGSTNGLALAFTAFLAAAFAALVTRYRAGDPQSRQQIKWLVLAAAGTLACQFAALAAVAAAPAVSVIAYAAITVIVLVGIPAAMTAAILRYRLYDIDRVISLTLVYGSVTVLLGSVYAGLVIGLGSLAGQDNALIIAGATLAVAALFNPLRRRLQKVIDRRFFRARYNAALALQAFAAGLRSEVDLQEIRTRLLAVTEETMQPAQAWLWLHDSNPLSTEITRPGTPAAR